MPLRARAPSPAGPAAADLPAGRSRSRAGGPRYRHLAGILREPIAAGAYSVGAVLPREADIARRFGVSLITVRQALRDLEADGLIRKRAAKPAIVADPSARPNPSWGFRTF